MFLTRTVTKKILETIVQESFSKFGSFSCSCLLDSLKLLGFYYATNAGISINIEDLKTPDVKKNFLKAAEDEVEFISKEWEKGFVSETERFQTIIDSWNFATESLKNRIVNYYQNFDPANNLYIMAFSGARGNMSQVRQLVGMRGLMADQEGKIIDLPIQTNFREGLSLIDYIISSYGARKGIVDTALKTADSGYLTRRLIYLTQEVIIRELDCKTNKGIAVRINHKTKGRNILGRSVISIIDRTNQSTIRNLINQSFLQEKDITELKQFSPIRLKIRSSITCSSYGSVCQKCYGADLAQQKIISLGEAVGIIAAQSIGEPGTQLTMRTFHTGGIFTSESLKQIRSPFSGKVILPDSLKTVLYRTNHGILVSKMQQEVNLTLLNWEGKKTTIFLPIGSYFYLTASAFVKKDQLIAEYSTQTLIPGIRRLKPIYSKFSGEVRFEKVTLLRIFRKKSTIKLIRNDGIMWVAAGKICPIPKESKFHFPKCLKKKKPIASLTIVSPFNGIIIRSGTKLSILNDQEKYTFDFAPLNRKFPNVVVELSLTVRNYQYIDKYTKLGYLNLFSNFEGKIYSTRKKKAKYLSTFFFITDSDIWKIHSDQVNRIPLLRRREKLARTDNSFTINSFFSKNGFLIKKDGLQMIFQKADPIFLTAGTISHYNQGDFVIKNKLFATLVNYTQQTEDIVQGLPKIEELIEARKPKRKAYLCRKPGLLTYPNYTFELVRYKKDKKFDYKKKIEGSILNSFQFYQCFKIFGHFIKTKKPVKKKRKKKISIPLQILTSLSSKEKNNLCFYKGYLVKVKAILPCFQPSTEMLFSGNLRYSFERIPEENEGIREEFLFNKNSKERDVLDFLNPYSKWSRSCVSDPEIGEGRENRLDLDRLILNNKKLTRTWEHITPNPSQFTKKKLLSTPIYKLKGNKKIFLANLKLSEYYRNKKLKNVFIFQTTKKEYILAEFLNPGAIYSIPLELNILPKLGEYIDLGEALTDGVVDIHELLSILAEYHGQLDGTRVGAMKSLNKFQLILINSIQAIYQSQGVNIAGKHLEIIVRQMTSKVIIKKSGDTPLIPGELVKLGLMSEICKAFESAQSNFMQPQYEPFLLSATNSSLNREGFLAAAGFQETKRILTKAALEGKVDWLRGLKESVIVGKLIPAGSAFLNYKSYLDDLYLFKSTFSS